MSSNLEFICSGGELDQIGKKLYPSEGYILRLRHMLKEYGRGPDQWDEDYPEEMGNKLYPEDSNALVQIDVALNNRSKLKDGSTNKGNGSGG